MTRSQKKEKVLVLLGKSSLTRNILSLALTHSDWETQFATPEEVSQSFLKRYSTLIVDDSAAPSTADLYEILGPEGQKRKVLYLSQEEKVQFDSSLCLPWYHLTKPFSPEELWRVLSIK